MCVFLCGYVCCVHTSTGLSGGQRFFEAWELGLEVNVDALQEQYVPIETEPCLLLQDISKFFFYLFLLRVRIQITKNSNMRCFQYMI